MTLLSRAARFVSIALVVIVAAVIFVVVVSQTAWFKNQLRRYIVDEAQNYVNGTVSVDRLGGNVFSGVELEGITISSDAQAVVSVKEVGVDYNLFEIVSHGVSVDHLRLNGVVLYLERRSDGTWSVADLIKRQEQEADRQGLSSPIRVDDISVSDASITIDDRAPSDAVVLPQKVDHLDATLAFRYEPVRYSLDVSRLSFRTSDPKVAVNALSGRVSVADDALFLENVAIRTQETSLAVSGDIKNYLTRPELALALSSDKASLQEIAHLVPALRDVALQPAFELQLNGPLDRLAVEANVRSSAGKVRGSVLADIMAPDQSLAGALSIEHLDLAPLLNDPAQRSDLTGEARVDLHAKSLADVDGIAGTVSVKASHLAAAGYLVDRVEGDARIRERQVAIDVRGAAYGADVSGRGRVTLPKGGEAFAFDVSGRASRVNLRRLPSSLGAPAAETAIAADYHVTGVTHRFRAAFSFEPSTVEGARIERGSTAAVDYDRGQLGYRANAKVRALDLQRVGTGFGAEALADARYKTSINGEVALVGRGTALKDLAATANGTLTNSTVVGGTIAEATFAASVAGDAAQMKIDGHFLDVDPSVIADRPALKGTLAGQIAMDATASRISEGVRLDSVAGDARLTLEPSSLGDLAIDCASLDASYRDQRAEIRSLDVTGLDLNVTAAGTLALDDRGDSNVQVHADTASVEAVGRLFELPIKGRAQIDGTVTGNRTELRAEGTVVGSSLAYGEQGALSATSDYRVIVPDLDAARATVVADTRATLVKIAGHDVNELAAKTTYVDNTLTFDGTAKAPDRSLDVAGSLGLRTDEREIRLRRLSLVTGSQTWALAPGQDPTIRYAADRVVVSQFALVNGDERLVAEGTVGDSGDALKVTLSNVNLADVDAVLLREPQFFGRVNAAATVTGTLTAPTAKGEFEVTDGAFRQFHYESLKGTGDYSAAGFTFDARLQQNAAQWIAAKGYVPSAAFQAAPGSRAVMGAHVEPESPADRIDVSIESSPIDLGLIQGLTTTVTNVKGSAEAHLRVTGSARDPHPDGFITIADGQMTVAPTGVPYSNIAGKIEFLPDRVHIDQLTVLDNHQSAMTLTGDLAVHAGGVGGVQLWVNAEDFKLLDNDMGDVRLQAAVEIAGELRSPVLRGDVGVSTGQVNLDQLIALAGPSPYATQETEYVRSTTLQKEPASADSLFGRMTIDLRLWVPNDLIVKASSLRTPGAPLSLGALNVTLGGDLRATKAASGPVLLVGSVNTIRGTYDFQGRRFDILRDGSIRFEGLDELDPRLDLRARREIQSVEARVNVGGTLSRPSVSFSSTPPLEEADILSLILFNQPVNQLAETQQLSVLQRGQALAAGALANQLAQSLGNALNLNTFEIDLGPESKGAQVTVGQQVGQNLFFRVEQGIGDQSATSVILEYELRSWLRLQTTIVQGSSSQDSLFRRQQSTGGDLIFLFNR